MDIKGIIIEELEKKGKIKASEIVKATGFSRAYINRFFQELRDEGRIVLIGRANRANYVLATEKAVLTAKESVPEITLNLQNKALQEDKVIEEIRKKTGIFIGTKQNVSDILNYAFSEMLNNAIEHSNSEIIKITMKKDKNSITFSIIDEGIGIFNNIMEKKGLNNIMSAIQNLLKGKQTTDPQMHSGEGIFFTSKVGDIFIIQGSNKKLIFNNLLDDIFIKDIKEINGTKVNFSMDLKSNKNLSNIFKEWTDSSFEFSKTMVTVRLYKMKSPLLSRSQARRIVQGLDKFKTVILDFKEIETVGQGFADEIFRVFQSNHPKIIINAVGTNENVQFMINRAISGQT
ncbi:DUF4325 domain-containing protein [bacterium]|nr:DUF4325 domain-containing protein [bacterium]